MSNRLFVGGLPWAVDDDGLHQAFAEYGEITDCKVITERDSGRSRGFGFVTFASAEEAQAAIEGMDGQDLGGRTLKVNVARERTGGGGGGGRRGGFGGGRGGGGGRGFGGGGGGRGGYGGGGGGRGGYGGGGGGGRGGYGGGGGGGRGGGGRGGGGGGWGNDGW
jgi:hypothetical protein